MKDFLEALGFGCVVGVSVFVGLSVYDWWGAVAGVIAAAICVLAGTRIFFMVLAAQRQRVWRTRLPAPVAGLLPAPKD